MPLVLAHGAGAEARAALGWVIVGALGFAAVSTLYLTPATYLMFARFSKPRSHEERTAGARTRRGGRAAAEADLAARPAE